MPLCKIKVNYENVEGWMAGDVVDITYPNRLIEEGKVEYYHGPVDQQGKPMMPKPPEAKQEVAMEVFSCVECNKLFKNKLGLTSHMRTHEDKRDNSNNKKRRVKRKVSKTTNL